MEIVFYKSNEHPNFYLVYRGANGIKPHEHIKRMTHAKGFENSGYPKINIEVGFVLKPDAPDRFFEYLVEKVATNHIPAGKYDEGTFRAWYEFKDVSNTDKWLSEFYAWQRQQRTNASAIQTSLF